MNFATSQDLTIPEGAVKQITDASGRVLWSAEKTAEIYIVVNEVRFIEEMFITSGQITVNGTQYDSKADGQMLTLPVGTVIQCRCASVAWKGATVAPVGIVSVNGVVVAQSPAVSLEFSPEVNKDLIHTADANYNYTVTKNATIELTGYVPDEDMSAGTYVIITEH